MLLTGSSDSYVQFIVVLLIFIVVLAVTTYVTKWIANYQKQQNVNCNIEVIETTRISNNKYIQIIRAGDTYMVIAVCKDTVTMLGEVPKEQLKEARPQQLSLNFKEMLERAVKKDSSNDDQSKE
ncbi:MAG: hypothetical protein E7291_07165 [Lachnospiraceae bacterium]|nr:hypothetical protein [Lachnospiraceae bacterium]